MFGAMPFDAHHFPSPDEARIRRYRRQVTIWLGAVAVMIFGMVVLGGATRATGSGLSIMEWAPLSGTMPPLGHAEWERLFAEYKTIPQYRLLHPGMGLDGFRQIFWLEWVHRFWGRLTGMVFLLPLLFFVATRRIERRLVPGLALLFVLGGLQGAVGWFMVSSGFFPDSTEVSAYRLVVHLGLALLLYGAVLVTALLYGEVDAREMPPAPGLRRLALLTLALTSCTIVAGGFTAGLHAGLVDNTFPLMQGRIVPPGYAALTPFARNLFENPEAVQFDHRLLATLAVLAALATAAAGLRPSLPRVIRWNAAALGGAVLLQYALGVATLLQVVPAPLAVVHQANAVLLLTAALTLAVRLRLPHGASVPVPSLASC